MRGGRSIRSRLLSASIIGVVAITAIVAGASPACAQETERWFVRGLGGLTFGDTETGGTVAGGFGLQILPQLQVIGEIGRLDNVFEKSARTNLTLAALSLGTTVGGPVTFSTTEPADYGMALVRISPLEWPHVVPFFEGGGGMARVTSSLSAESGGVTETTALLSRVTLTPAQTRDMLSAGGGVTFAFDARWAIDVGYRFGRILMNDTPLDVHRVYSSVRLSF